LRIQHPDQKAYPANGEAFASQLLINVMRANGVTRRDTAASIC